MFLRRVLNKLVDLNIVVSENSQDMIAYWDKDLLCRYANKAYFEWFGWDPQAMINKITLKELLGPLYPLNLPFINMALKGKAQIFNRTIVSPKGIVRNSIAAYYPDFGPDGVEGFVVHVQDVLDRAKEPLNDPRFMTVRERQFQFTKEPYINVENALRGALLTGFPGLHQLAKDQFMSPATLKRGFKGYYGMTVFTYFRFLQMQFAERYLEKESFTVKQVAEMLRFANSTNFSRCYSKYRGAADKSRAPSNSSKTSEPVPDSIIKNIPGYWAVFNPAGKKVTGSSRFLQILNSLGGQSEEISILFKLFLPLEPDGQIVMNRLLAGETIEATSDAEAKTASVARHLRLKLRPIHDTSAKIVAISAVITDETSVRNSALERDILVNIVNQHSGKIRVGRWTRNLKTGKAIYDEVTNSILEITSDFQHSSYFEWQMYKPGKDRDIMLTALSAAIHRCRSFDVTVRLITGKKNERLVRICGFPQFSGSKCISLSGLLIEI